MGKKDSRTVQEVQELQEVQEVQKSELTHSLENALAVFDSMQTGKHNVIIAGQERSEYTFETERKKDGKTELVTVTLRGALAVSTMDKLEKLESFKGQATKLICLSMGKFTKRDAENAGFKSVRELIIARFPYYEANTINMYRNVALLFAEDNESADSYSWCDGIDSDTSVTNLSCIVRVLKLKERKIDLEKLSKDEIIKLRNEVIHYIIIDDLHPLLPLIKLRKEVDIILNPPITAEFTVSDSDGKQEDGKQEDGKQEDGKQETIDSEWLSDKVARIQKATDACNLLMKCFTDNEVIKESVCNILEEIGRIANE